MWKLILAFILFAAIAMYMLSKGGDLDLSGEKHGIEAAPHPAATASEPAPAASH
ncbi:MAG: hypothetical protein U1F53_19630 [Burkholderiaceae bacterium]